MLDGSTGGRLPSQQVVEGGRDDVGPNDVGKQNTNRHGAGDDEEELARGGLHEDHTFRWLVMVVTIH